VDGIVTAAIDPDTLELATFACPTKTTEVFIAGSQPTRYCYLHGGQGRRVLLATNVAGWDRAPKSGTQGPDAKDPAAEQDGLPPSITIPLLDVSPGAAASAGEKPKEKKGFFGRVLDIFR